ncbi:MAG: rhomboid family intramembrane serine protease [Chloroflexi bacterium]|nr:rhomboid family intramembrane serine protease [Chloroflexota bacterium]
MRNRSYQDFNLGPIGFLIIANLIVFVATSIRPQFVYFLGLSPASFSHMPWTILTNLFVHAGVWHILTNMLTLYFFGSYLISLVGDKRFFVIYFVGGIAGNIVYLLLASPMSIAVGASGAIFAVAGALTVMKPKLPVFIFPMPVPISLWVAVIGGFLILSFAPLVAWQAHLGGLVFGLAAGYFFQRPGNFFRKREGGSYWRGREIRY